MVIQTVETRDSNMLFIKTDFVMPSVTSYILSIGGQTILGIMFMVTEKSTKSVPWISRY